MFTEKDYRDYFLTLLEKERDMIAFLEIAKAKVSDPELIVFFENIESEEKAHSRLAKELVSLTPLGQE